MRFPSWLVYILHVWAGWIHKSGTCRVNAKVADILLYNYRNKERCRGGVMHQAWAGQNLGSSSQKPVFSCPLHLFLWILYDVQKPSGGGKVFVGLSWFCHILRFSSWPGIQTAQHGCHPPSELNPWWCEPFENVRNPGLDGAFIISMPGADFFVISHRCKWASFPFIVIAQVAMIFWGATATMRLWASHPIMRNWYNMVQPSPTKDYRWSFGNWWFPLVERVPAVSTREPCTKIAQLQVPRTALHNLTECCMDENTYQ